MRSTRRPTRRGSHGGSGPPSGGTQPLGVGAQRVVRGKMSAQEPATRTGPRPRSPRPPASGNSSPTREAGRRSARRRARRRGRAVPSEVVSAAAARLARGPRPPPGNGRRAPLLDYRGARRAGPRPRGRSPRGRRGRGCRTPRRRAGPRRRGQIGRLTEGRGPAVLVAAASSSGASSSDRPSTSGPLSTAGRAAVGCPTRISPVYDVRRQSVSTPRSKRRDGAGERPAPRVRGSTTTRRARRRLEGARGRRMPPVERGLHPGGGTRGADWAPGSRRRVATAQKAMQAAAAGVPAGRPPGDDLRLRPGQPDVGQAQRLAGLLGRAWRRARPGEPPPTSSTRLPSSSCRSDVELSAPTESNANGR